MNITYSWSDTRGPSPPLRVHSFLVSSIQPSLLLVRGSGLWIDVLGGGDTLSFNVTVREPGGGVSEAGYGYRYWYCRWIQGILFLYIPCIH